MYPFTRRRPRTSTIYLLITLAITAWSALGRPLPQFKESQAAVSSPAKPNADASAKQKGRFEAIRKTQLGWRTVGKNPLREQVELIEPDPATWRHISLEMLKDDGLRLWVELLRSLEWIADYEAKVGGTIFLDLEEMGAVGDALVTSIAPCPPIQPGPGGGVVTGIFKHESDGHDVMLLTIEGEPEPTTVTSNHRYWSDDRRDYVPVAELREGERLDTESGIHPVISVIPHPNYSGLLYNIETTEHVYRVGLLAALAHNTCEGQHHFFPWSWGNKIPYKHPVLKKLSEAEHTRIHKAWSDFLEKRTGKRFQSMSGEKWRKKLDTNERSQLVHDFVREYGDTPEGIALAKSLTPKNPGLSLFDLFKAEYKYMMRFGLLEE